MIKFCVLGGRRSIVVAYADYVVRVWDCGDMTWSHTLPPTGAIATARCTVLSLSGHDVLAFGCADGRIRTWRPGQSRYRVSLQRHEGWIANIAQTTVAGELALVTVGSEGTLRLWLDMERCEVFPLSEPATRMACEGQEIILATGPALSKVKVGEGVPTLTPPRTDEHRTAFSSDQELPFDISTESAPDQALRLTVRSPVANQMRQAKSMARADQHGEAVIRLLPYVASHPPAVCLAADIAFQSNDRSVIDYVLPHVMSTHVRGLVVVQARLLALALLTDRDDLAAACAPTIMQSPHEACAALIEMFDAGNWEDEWRVYERASELPRRTADELELTEVIASLCAARLLAMCRRSAGDDLEEFDRRRSALLERYWQLNATDERRARLAQVLSSYPASPHSGFHALPYQVVSIYHTLEARYPAAAEAHRTRLVREISSVLQAGTARRHQQFAQWAALSGLAAGVMEAWTP